MDSRNREDSLEKLKEADKYFNPNRHTKISFVDDKGNNYSLQIVDDEGNLYKTIITDHTDVYYNMIDFRIRIDDIEAVIKGFTDSKEDITKLKAEVSELKEELDNDWSISRLEAEIDSLKREIELLKHKK